VQARLAPASLAGRKKRKTHKHQRVKEGTRGSEAQPGSKTEQNKTKQDKTKGGKKKINAKQLH
jgi:hypothetical protein